MGFWTNHCQGSLKNVGPHTVNKSFDLGTTIALTWLKKLVFITSSPTFYLHSDIMRHLPVQTWLVYFFFCVQTLSPNFESLYRSIISGPLLRPRPPWPPSLPPRATPTPAWSSCPRQTRVSASTWWEERSKTLPSTSAGSSQVTFCSKAAVHV